MSTVMHTVGVDPGASGVKVAVVRSDAGGPVGAELLASGAQRLRRREVAEVALSEYQGALTRAGIDPPLGEEINDSGLDYIASTGDGDAVGWRTGHFYSPTAHARGALFFEPEARAVIDVGALHARALRMDERGRVLSHRMTSQCASGSGQFLENIARYLGVPLEDVGPLSASADAPERVSGICAVLAETDVINMVARGVSTANILKGIHLSIAARLVALLRKIRADGVVMLTGGLSADEGLVGAIREVMAKDAQRKSRVKLELELRTHADAILAGAVGAALLGAYRRTQLSAS